eukprot:7378945-Karenia_brevis.AAC.1
MAMMMMMTMMMMIRMQSDFFHKGAFFTRVHGEFVELPNTGRYGDDDDGDDGDDDGDDDVDDGDGDGNGDDRDGH